MNDDDNTDGILSRWSKRKRGLDDDDNEKADTEASLSDDEAALKARELELAANRQAAEEIDLDTIDEESDLSLFMKEGVPSALKKAALAKLWRSNPVFANVDGLVDYDDNFADPKLIMKTFTSAYQVGKGYLKEVLEEDPEEIISEHETIKAEKEELISASAPPVEEETPNEDIEEPVASEINSHDNITDETETIEVAKIPLRARLGLVDSNGQS